MFRGIIFYRTQCNVAIHLVAELSYKKTSRPKRARPHIPSKDTSRFSLNIKGKQQLTIRYYRGSRLLLSFLLPCGTVKSSVVPFSLIRSGGIKHVDCHL